MTAKKHQTSTKTFALGNTKTTNPVRPPTLPKAQSCCGTGGRGRPPNSRLIYYSVHNRRDEKWEQSASIYDFTELLYPCAGVGM